MAVLNIKITVSGSADTFQNRIFEIESTMTSHQMAEFIAASVRQSFKNGGLKDEDSTAIEHLEPKHREEIRNYVIEQTIEMENERNYRTHQECVAGEVKTWTDRELINEAIALLTDEKPLLDQNIQEKAKIVMNLLNQE